MPDETANKPLHIWAPNSVPQAISFCLHVHAIKSKPVLIDHAVHATVASSAKLCGGIPVRTTVSHRNEKIDDYLLKESRAVLENALQKIIA